MSDPLLLLAMGGVNGVLHALDADHVVAVSTLAARGQLNRRKLVTTALHWALGHGLMLSIICFAVILFGLTLPEWLSGLMEAAVGVILILVGLSVSGRFLISGGRLSKHRHDAMPEHVHIHGHDHDRFPDHKPVLVGLVHGAAGSAPLLAVLPLVVREQIGLASLFILLFSLSVALMMCVCGGLLGGMIARLQRRFHCFSFYSQIFLGFLSVFLGFFWIAGSS